MKMPLYITATVIWLLVLLPSAMMALFSPMMFDAPGSESSRFTSFLFVSVLLLPVFCLIGAGIPWIFYKTRFGGWLFLIPLIDVGAVAVAFFLIAHFCNGQFTCK